MIHPIISDHAPPLVIGATGGSGTRVVARIAARAGYRFGTNLNSSEDALDFVAFHDRWINRLLRAERAGKPLSPKESEAMEHDFKEALMRHLSTIPGSDGAALTQWGWKAPRTIYLIAFLHAIFPGLKFIHVVRDGRDMAFSKNQNQLRKHGRELLTWRERWLRSVPIRSLILWERANLRAADYGEAHLRNDYLLFRFEDLCDAPERGTRTILRFLGSPADPASVARDEVSPPASIGRWRRNAPETLARLQRTAARALRRFGYVDRVD